MGIFGTCRKIPKNRKMLIFQPISTNFFLQVLECLQESNGAKIKILAIKIKDLEKSRIMNA